MHRTMIRDETEGWTNCIVAKDLRTDYGLSCVIEDGEDSCIIIQTPEAARNLAAWLVEWASEKEDSK